MLPRLGFVPETMRSSLSMTARDMALSVHWRFRSQCGSTLFYYLTHLAAGYVAAIGFRARNNAFVAVDDRKRHGIVSTLEVQRLIIGAVNMNDLARTQANPNLLRSTVVVAVTRHDVDVAVAINWPVEGDDVFIANRRHNGLIRPNRA